MADEPTTLKQARDHIKMMETYPSSIKSALDRVGDRFTRRSAPLDDIAREIADLETEAAQYHASIKAADKLLKDVKKLVSAEAKSMAKDLQQATNDADRVVTGYDKSLQDLETTRNICTKAEKALCKALDAASGDAKESITALSGFLRELLSQAQLLVKDAQGGATPESLKPAMSSLIGSIKSCNDAKITAERVSTAITTALKNEDDAFLPANKTKATTLKTAKVQLDKLASAAGAQTTSAMQDIKRVHELLAKQLVKS